MLRWRFINLWISNCILTFAGKNYLKLVSTAPSPGWACLTMAMVPCPVPVSQDLFPTSRARFQRSFLRLDQYPGHWRFSLIEAPACTEHFKYLQRYFKKRFWHVLFLFGSLLPSLYPLHFPCNCCCYRCCFCCSCWRVQRSAEFSPSWSSVLLIFWQG